jgi:RNA polymerase sigma factor (sigma-70 family)
VTAAAKKRPGPARSEASLLRAGFELALAHRDLIWWVFHHRFRFAYVCWAAGGPQRLADLEQDVFVAVAEAYVRRHRRRSKFSDAGLVAGAARYTVLQHAARRRGQRGFGGADLPVVPLRQALAVPDPDPGPVEAAALAERRARVLALLDTLTERERNVLYARLGLFEGYEGVTYTFKEIGKVLGVGQERVRQIAARTLRLLQHPDRSRRLYGFTESHLATYDGRPPRGLEAYDGRHFLSGVTR